MTDVQPVAAALTEPGVFLVGRPPVAEFLGYVQAQAAYGEVIDLGALTGEWRAANDHVKELERTEAGRADGATLGDIPAELRDRVQAVKESFAFQNSFELTPWEVRMVELDRLVVHQKLINLAQVDRVKFQLGVAPDPEQVFDACLPLSPETPSWNPTRIAQNGFAFFSPSNDLRFLGVELVSPAALGMVEKHGRPVAAVALFIGFTVNALSVISAEGRLLLQNGSHRAYALRELGVTHVPAVVTHVSRRDELELVAAAEVVAKPDQFLTEPRPPLLVDYFDDRLRKVVDVPASVRQVRVAWSVEMADNPAGM